MRAIGGEPIKQNAQAVTVKDGRKVRLPGLPRRIEPDATEERGVAAPARDHPAPAHDPHHAIQTRPTARTRAG